MTTRAPKPKAKYVKQTAKLRTNTFTAPKPIPAAPSGEGQSERAELLLEMAKSLDDAPRNSEAEDVPEGTRWVRLSHTLATQIAARLRMIAGRMG